jgi:Leucine-rich repeat (LRR) protein
MSNLKVLDLAGNALTGGLPDSMSCLVHLEYLKLQSNKLSGLSAHTTIIFIILILLLLLGQIPPWMKLLKSLKEVNLSKNKLIGGQNNFNECINLERLVLNENILRGTIEASVSSLQSLKILYMHNNKIEGRIPRELISLKNLEHLNLSNNYLEGLLSSSTTTTAITIIVIIIRNFTNKSR